MTELLKLTDDNYFSQKADKQYLSVSQFKSFMEEYHGCEAQAMAKINGIWKEEESTALLVGSYFHSNFEGSLDKFKSDHPDIFTKQGTLKSNYQQANEMINCLETDESFKKIYVGDKEKIFTGELFGAMWKIKVDCFNEKEGYFVDLKTVRDFENQWVFNKTLGRRVPKTFVEAWGYLIQIAIYREILCQSLKINSKDMEGFIIAVTKQNPPDKVVLYFKPEDYELGLNIVKDNVQHVLDVKSGKIQPKRCEKCSYCRATKKLDKAIHYSDLNSI